MGALTISQVKKAENDVNYIIKDDREVFAKTAPLAEAKKVIGIRAMFSEAYPDPVRIVSVGAPVSELIKNPESKAALDTSVEFCGGTHLHRSSHIGDFIITSEDAIAKGIRRIIAITGPDAVKARKHAAILESACQMLKNSINSNILSKEDALNAINVHLKDISDASISYYKKDELRNLLKGLKKSIDDAERAGKNEQTVLVINQTKEILNQTGSSPFIVARLNAGSNTKALDAALKQVKQTLPNVAAMFFSSDEKAKKVFCLCMVSQCLIQRGLKANEWINNVCSIIGGKGGGKEEAAQASGNNYEAISNAISSSIKFAETKLNMKVGVINDSPCLTYGIYNPASIVPAVALQYSGLKIQECYENKLSYVDKDVQLSDPLAIAFLLASQQLKGSSISEEAQIIQWELYVKNTFSTAVWTIISTSEVKGKNTKAIKAKQELTDSLKYMNKYLERCTYLVGERITLADIIVFSALIPVFHKVLNAQEKKQFINLKRWYDTIQNQPQVLRVVSKITF